MIEPTYIQGKTALSWSGVSIDTANPIEQAMYWAEKKAVLVLLRNNEGGKLSIYSLDGSLLTTISEPEGFEFYYLAKHAKLGLSVVCVSSELTEGWHDWHFGIDVSAGRVFRDSPSK